MSARQPIDFHTLAIDLDADDRERTRPRLPMAVSGPDLPGNDPVNVLLRDTVHGRELRDGLAVCVSYTNVVGEHSCQDVNGTPYTNIGIDGQVVGAYAHQTAAEPSYVSSVWYASEAQLVRNAHR